MEIYSQNEDGCPKMLIGKLMFKIIYVGEANNNNYDLYEIFDTYEYTFRHAQEFFDFETNEIKADIQKFYNYTFINSDICLIERIEILPEYRGRKIAAKATKDIIFHFGSGCELFILQAYPLQFEVKREEQNEWQSQLELGKFPIQEKKAFKQLKNYYKSWGFDEISGYNELLFLNPAIRNKKMERINLEE
jgi:hypothetical protein